MSVLLVGVTGDLAGMLVSRLVSLSDDVRMIDKDPDAIRKWTALGAHVARGDADDEDLIERSAHGVRTVVVAQPRDAPLADVVAAVVEGAPQASPEVRLVVCMRRRDHRVANLVRSCGLDYVMLRTGERSWRHNPFSGIRGRFARKLVEAIDAADDLAGHPRLEVDLSDPKGWRELGAEGPQG